MERDEQVWRGVRYPYKEAEVKKRGTMAAINEKVERGEAVVMTSDERKSHHIQKFSLLKHTRAILLREKSS
jgi:hypothetical protein